MLRLWPVNSRSLVFFALFWLSAVAFPLEIRADDATPNGVGSREIWLGADVGAHNWLVYSGGTYAPWGDIHADGFRLRATTGYGHYDYHWDRATKVDVDKAYADALVGYQLRYGELTAKAFAGWAILSDLDVPSATVRKARFNTGFKTALELWLNLGSQAWTSLDLAYADTRQTWSIRSRIGYRMLPTVSVGLEGIVNHSSLVGQVQINKVTEQLAGNARVGAFVRYEWFGGEISASGGLTGDINGDLGNLDLLQRPSPYGTLNWIIQF